VHFGEQPVVFVQPSSNLIGSGLELLLGLAGRNGR
jgi:hypothetical protein